MHEEADFRTVYSRASWGREEAVEAAAPCLIALADREGSVGLDERDLEAVEERPEGGVSLLVQHDECAETSSKPRQYK